MRLLLALAALSVLATAIPAKASNCYVKCMPDGRGGQVCYNICSP
jgi:hypothetical protein